MVATPKFLLVDERLGDSLHDRLRYWRAAGVSYNAIARMLEAETRVRLTGQTVRDWILRLDDGEAA